jgi:Leucine-rich repeat (LRR) protein
MSTAVIDFFRTHYKSNITEDELKDIVKLDLSKKYIKTLPSGVFDKCVNLHTLYLSYNKLTAIDPNTFVNNVNLHTLKLYKIN